MPRLVYPRVIFFLWILLVLLLFSLFITWWVRLPIYASGPAIVIDSHHTGQTTPNGLALVAFLPSGQLPDGKSILVLFDNTSARTQSEILQIYPTTSPASARTQFGLDGSSAALITQPSSIVIARFDPPQTGLASQAYLGSIFEVEVETGSRRAISFIPLIGQFFK